MSVKSIFIRYETSKSFQQTEEETRNELRGQDIKLIIKLPQVVLPLKLVADLERQKQKQQTAASCGVRCNDAEGNATICGKVSSPRTAMDPSRRPR